MTSDGADHVRMLGAAVLRAFELVCAGPVGLNQNVSNCPGTTSCFTRNAGM